MDTPSPPLRKRSMAERREWLLQSLTLDAEERAFFDGQQVHRELADRMVETAVGWFELPVGIVSGLIVNGASYEVPLATEEPSVIAAATYGARILGKSGGVVVEASDPIMRAQVFLEGPRNDAAEVFLRRKEDLEAAARQGLVSMESRGGGLRGLSCHQVDKLDVLAINFDVDVRDAMGANLLNTLAEAMTPLLEQVLGGRKILAILSNDASMRPVTARFRLGVAALAKPGFTGPEMARRIALAGEIAQADPQRAVTHNKGIMNGVSALALATGNDARALEAGVHSFASRSGVYRGLSTYRVEGDVLVGELTLPLALATVGGSTKIHPGARLNLKLLGVRSATELTCVAAALGLAQNFAALFALTGEGIQRGHMALHLARERTDK